MAGFTGVFSAGWIAGVTASLPETSSGSVAATAETVVFGAGESGLAASASFDRSEVVAALSSAARRLAEAREESAESVLQQRSKSAVRTTDHLSDCRPGEGGPGKLQL